MLDNSDHNDWMETGCVHKPSDQQEREDLRTMVYMVLIDLAALAIAVLIIYKS